MFSYILFDLDGTVSDPKIGITRSVQYALRALGIEEADLNRLAPFIGPPLRDSFREYYGSVSYTHLDVYKRQENNPPGYPLKDAALLPGYGIPAGSGQPVPCFLNDHINGSFRQALTAGYRFAVCPPI